MYKITKNSFINKGIVEYEDEYGNKAKIRRKGDKAILRCQCILPHTVISPYTIDCNENGNNLNMVYNKKYACTSEFINSVKNIQELILRWVEILRAIKFLYMPNDLIASMYEYKSSDKEELASKKKLEQLEHFEEFADIIKAL